ncbi:MAG: hypothetical protein U9R47_00415 [Actinomycetota bacterium]|nr:hypothetical protein [Actinomycetota bacterium]
MGATITDSQRIAHLEQKVEFLDQSVADLRRAVEALNTLVGENRLEQIRVAVRPDIVPDMYQDRDEKGTRLTVSAVSRHASFPLPNRGPGGLA